MPTCQICLKKLKKIRFKSARIGICTRCVNTLNESPEPAIRAQERLREMLARGMMRNAPRDLESDEEWKRRKARWVLENFEEAVEAALPNWLNRLLADSKNNTRDFKLMRAYRRGLLRFNPPPILDYPPNWPGTARSIRLDDKFQCSVCGQKEATLDVHHIIYKSNLGTDQKTNLITLCRACHEAEHGHMIDPPEENDPESASPIRPPSGKIGQPRPTPKPPERTEASATTTQKTSPPNPNQKPVLPTAAGNVKADSEEKVALICPTCLSNLKIPKSAAHPSKMVRCPICTVTFNYLRGLPPSVAPQTPEPQPSAPVPAPSAPQAKVIQVPEGYISTTQYLAKYRTTKSAVDSAIRLGQLGTVKTNDTLWVQDKPITRFWTTPRLLAATALMAVFVMSGGLTGLFRGLLGIDQRTITASAAPPIPSSSPPELIAEQQTPQKTNEHNRNLPAEEGQISTNSAISVGALVEAERPALHRHKTIVQHKPDYRPCVFRPVMTDDDYRACGAKPPNTD